jgi:hypothetical protein
MQWQKNSVSLIKAILEEYFMKKVLFCFLLIIGFWRTYAQEFDIWDYWKATDSVVIGDKIHEYELYSINNNNLDSAVLQLIENFWEYDGDSHDATFSRNRSTVYSNNTGLSPDVKRMMNTMKVNISTTKYFLIDSGRCFLYFTVNYYKRFRNIFNMGYMG